MMRGTPPLFDLDLDQIGHKSEALRAAATSIRQDTDEDEGGNQE